MRIIVGLGNPGKEYEETRHNVGFMVVERILEKLAMRQLVIKNWKIKNKFKAEIAEIKWGIGKSLLVKPQTHMNSSGVAVKKIIDFYKSPNYSITQLLNYLYIIHDDLDLQLGDYKIQLAKGPKRHNGILSVEKELGTKDFWRVRIGIAKPEAEKKECLFSGKDYVLGKFTVKEKEVFNQVIKKAINQLLEKDEKNQKKS